MVEISKIEPISVVDHGLIMAEAMKSFTTPQQIEALEGELLGSSNNIPVSVSHAFCKGVYSGRFSCHRPRPFS
jgi:hypothetical protein